MTDYGPDGKYGKVCSVPACGRYTKTYGWCAKHYLFWFRGGRITKEGYELVKPEPYIRPKEFKCRIDECKTNATGSKGLCKTHYTTFIRHGDPEYKRPSKETMFAARINKTNSCWFWTGPVNGSGYGTFDKIGAHVYSYILHKGAVPEGLEIGHSCHIRHCVNPEHLEAMTHSDNLKMIPQGTRKLKTHCAKGHKFKEKNIYWYKGLRKCRKCRAVAKQTFLEKNG